ncbi:two-component system response regulator TctD [Roseovarius halotolerans]|uniref:Transcriptional regulatory protein tctD n=1 Tax=Roseovarius halotolerans TaxID=505353 RepID=A0A1X6YGJ3_9RHOB|nr:response regulator transcription factor [Roseovarius halotolerans]RKT34781.1 two-component system response regulator TctD [Roseovarius halotolerans]SLN18827.1 Transcriptional regulatory protein tctD [Roseovarius halotolerans]
MRYLLVEDNVELADAVIKRLVLDGHAVDHATTLAGAEDCLAVAGYDLILLDVMLPDGDGRDFLARSRAHLETPVIVLTARSQVADRVSALDQGADDYITKPFDFAELEARCRAVMRRRGGSARNEIALGPVIFDLLAGTLSDGNEIVELRHREIRLLEVFARHQGQILSKSHLMDRLFSYDTSVTENAIEVYVGRLRRRIEGIGLRIETVRGLGYRIETGKT